MNRYIAPLALAAAMLVPSVSSAAALTNQQAVSLIGVVQSSPGTPASAFTGLITAFSSITVAQAESLIAVVQGAPGVAPEAFVNLLISFTVDPISQSTQPSGNQSGTQAQSGTIQDMNTQPPASSGSDSGLAGAVTPPADTTPPVVRVQIADFSDVEAYPDRTSGFYLQVWSNEPLNLAATTGVVISSIPDVAGKYDNGARIDDSSIIRIGNSRSARIFPAFYYEAFLGESKPAVTDVIVQDVAGNKTTVPASSVFHI